VPAPPEYPPGRGLLAGKTVLITAAAGTGIGFATAKRCTEEGARVAITDIHERRLRESAAEIGAHAVLANVTSQDDVDRCFADVLGEFGHRRAREQRRPQWAARLQEMTDEQWTSVLDVTLTGTMRPRAALGHMGRRSGKRSSTTRREVVGWRARRGQSHYAAAKAGVMALTLRRDRVRRPGRHIRAVAPSCDARPSRQVTTGLIAQLDPGAFGRAAGPWESRT
jgi:3-oxoacyl-[acyl-carrier protein] reductase